MTEAKRSAILCKAICFTVRKGAHMSISAEKSYTVGMLLDFYGELLPSRQRQVADLYYNDDLSLSEVAEECGFSSISNFNRCFRQVTGISPSAYRKEFSVNGLI